jgi:cAMP phosphodiesterase
MRIQVLGCYGGNAPGKGTTSFLVDDVLAVDAGFVSGALSLEQQARVKDILISHSHLDHTCSLPFLIDNNFSAPGFSLRIYAIREVIESMKKHLFNNHTWPDFTSLPNDLTPVLKLVEIPEEKAVRINGLSIRAVRVSHLVPTAGFFIEDHNAAIGFSSDTGPTQRFWQVANKTRKLRAIVTETSFPNELQDLASISGHLTPITMAMELVKLKKDVPVYLYGMKPKHLKAIRKQLREVKDERVRMMTQGQLIEI